MTLTEIEVWRDHCARIERERDAALNACAAANDELVKVRKVLAEANQLRMELTKERNTEKTLREMAEKFHDVAVKERDYERGRSNRLEQERDACGVLLTAIQMHVGATGGVVESVKKVCAERDDARAELGEALDELVYLREEYVNGDPAKLSADALLLKNKVITLDYNKARVEVDLLKVALKKEQDTNANLMRQIEWHDERVMSDERMSEEQITAALMALTKERDEARAEVERMRGIEAKLRAALEQIAFPRAIGSAFYEEAVAIARRVL